MAVYGSLEKDVVHYYSFDLEEGERILSLSFQVLRCKRKGFSSCPGAPGSGIKDGRAATGAVGPAREASDLKILIAEGKSAASAVYEPFGPSSFIEWQRLTYPHQNRPATMRRFIAMLIVLATAQMAKVAL